jgi:hypothetical protein
MGHANHRPMPAGASSLAVESPCVECGHHCPDGAMEGTGDKVIESSRLEHGSSRRRFLPHDDEGDDGPVESDTVKDTRLCSRSAP